MLLFEVIGNLGADARVEESNGRKFVSFSVADSQRWTDENGTVHDTVQWVSCAMDGDGGKLLPHLKKGRLVYVVGRGSTRCYSSPKTRKFESGANISVLRVELLGGATDEVPRALFDADGAEHRTFKAFYVTQETVKELGIKKNETANLQTPDGKLFVVDSLGWVRPLTELSSSSSQESSGQSAENTAAGADLSKSKSDEAKKS